MPFLLAASICFSLLEDGPQAAKTHLPAVLGKPDDPGLWLTGTGVSIAPLHLSKTTPICILHQCLSHFYAHWLEIEFKCKFCCRRSESPVLISSEVRPMLPSTDPTLSSRGLFSGLPAGYRQRQQQEGVYTLSSTRARVNTPGTKFVAKRKWRRWGSIGRRRSSRSSPDLGTQVAFPWWRCICGLKSI